MPALFCSRRVRPGRDDKVLADWNGLAIAALARAAAVFRQPDWLARAEEACDFVQAQMGATDGRVQHAWRLGRITAAGLIDDQAAMARAALALFEATGSPDRLDQAIRIVEAAERTFSDDNGGFFTTAEDASDVPLARPRTAADNAYPAGNGLMVEVYARLYYLTGRPGWQTRAEDALRAFSGTAERLVAMPTLLASADLLYETTTVVVAGDPTSLLSADLVSTALSAADPAVVVLRATAASELPSAHPAYGKNMDTPAAYVCRRSACSLPLGDMAALTAALQPR